MLRDAFLRSGRLSVLSEAATRQSLAGRQQDLRDAVFLEPAQQALARARELAGQAEFRQAIDRLRRAEAHLTYYREHLKTNKDYLDVERFLLQLLLGLGAYDEASAVMQRLATMVPQLELDPLHFSPRSIALFDRVKSRVEFATGIEVSSEPTGATVFLDGTPRGVTPLFLPQIPQGRHYIRIEGDTGVFFEDFVLTSSDTREIHGVLGAPAFHSAGDDPQGRPITPPLIAVYSALGRFLQVDYLVFARLDREGLEAALFHVDDGTFTPSYKVPLNPERPAPALLRRLVDELCDLTGPTGEPLETAPLEQAPSPDSNFLLQAYFFGDQPGALSGALRAPHAARSGHAKPFYLRGWFWGATGAAAIAGGALAWVMMSESDDDNGTISIRFHFPSGE